MREGNVSINLKKIANLVFADAAMHLNTIFNYSFKNLKKIQ